MNISEVMNTPKPINGKRVFMSFSIGSVPVEVKSVPGSINFSENPKLAMFENELANFTLLELIRVSKMNPRVVLDRRVREVVRLVNGMNRDKIAENKYTINNYLNQYMMETILKAMSNPKVTQINLMYLLGLQRYIKNIAPVRNLQRLLVRIKKIQNTTGFISKIYQTDLKRLYAEVWNEFITGIEDKFIPEEKRGILSGRNEVNYDAENDEKLGIATAAFSKNTKIRDTIESILMKNDEITKSELDKLSKIKLTPEDEKELTMAPIFGDAFLTNLIIDFINTGVDKLTGYIKSEVGNFDENPIVKFFSDFSPESYQTGVQWNPDHSEAYLLAPQMKCWFLFTISKNETNKLNLIIRKFDNEVNYALVGYTDEEIKKLKSDAEVFGNYTFNYMNDLLDEFNKIVNNISKNSSTYNFSSKIKWTNIGSDIKLGFEDKDNVWRVFLIYSSDNGNFIEEFEFDKSNYKSIMNIKLDDIMSQIPLNRIKFVGSLDKGVTEVETKLLN